MDLDDTIPYTADDFLAYAEEAIERAEHSDDAQDRLEHLSRAQAWALLRAGEILAHVGDVLAARMVVAHVTAGNGTPRADPCVAAAALVTGALALCEEADLELAAILLRDASNCIIEDLGEARDESTGPDDGE